MVKKSRLDPKVKLDFVRYIANHMNQQIVMADRKAAWTFSALAVGTGAFVTKLTRIVWTEVNITYIMSFAILTAMLLITAFIQLAIVIYPRISKGKSAGISYFEDVISNKKAAYIKKGLKISEKQIMGSMYDEIYNLSEIASKKFKHVYYGIILGTIALICTLSFLLVA